MFLLTLLLACGTPDAAAPDALPADHAAPPAVVTFTPLVAGYGATATVVGAPQGTEALLFVTSTLSPGRTCPHLIRPACLDMAGPVTLLARQPAQPQGVDLRFQVPLSAAGLSVRLAVVIRGPQRSVALEPTVAMLLYPGGDTDNDGLSEEEEIWHSTDPFNPDTDGGGVRDGLEVAVGTHPLDAADNPQGACELETDCGADDWCTDVLCTTCGEPDCLPMCVGTCQPRDWCSGDRDCAAGTHCSTSDGVCDPDPSCPGCVTCTGTCVPGGVVCFDSAACPADEHCTVDDGACEPFTLCGADGFCFDECSGTCAPNVDTCLDSLECPSDEYCTVDDGVCDLVTLCSADGLCVDDCAGTCAPRPPAPIACLAPDVCESGICSLDHFGCDERFAPFCLGVCLDPVSCVTSDDCAGGAACSTEFGDCMLRDCVPGWGCVPECTGWCGVAP